MEYIEDIMNKFAKDLRYYGRMQKSDKYTQGIDIDRFLYLEKVPKRTTDPYTGPAVYFLIDNQGRLVKIGQTANLHNRMFRQYKCVTNATNNRIREHVRSVSSLSVHYVPLKQHSIDRFGYELKTSYSSALEYALLKEYKKSYTRLPELNTMIK